jgi:hypothetical protein
MHTVEMVKAAVSYSVLSESRRYMSLPTSIQLLNNNEKIVEPRELTIFLNRSPLDTSTAKSLESLLTAYMSWPVTEAEGSNGPFDTADGDLDVPPIEC